MSEATKLFSRPKVRFSPTDVNKFETKELKNSTDQTSVQQSSKPTITSIITLDKPVKLVKLNEVSTNRENKHSNVINNTQRPDSLTSCTNTVSCTIQTSSSSKENSTKTENHTPLSDANNVQNIKSNFKQIDISKTSIKHSSNDAIASSTKQSENLNKLNKSKKNCMETKSLKKDCTKNKRGKENEIVITKKGSKTIKSADLDILKHKARIFSGSTSTKKSNVTNKTLVTVKTQKQSNVEPIVVDVMPCYKYNKNASKLKAKAPAIKKTLIRDVIGPKIKPFIGPGVQHKKLDGLKSLEINNENDHVKPVVSGEKLARPEYNSIMCTINKLNEMKKQKIIPDIEHLPAVYKSVINGKVSSALDFPLDEAIYKNLVDLSIDENQLPSRLTRSKDPEPRQRDVVPVLSDFFVPASTEEYCTALSTKPRSLDIEDSWDAFRISTQICEWKYNLDHT
ncbi:unnamed protein product [Xylocopa violacea]|uniref:Protein phosphatase 1 regulatory subunit 35 C-terminal domain-containing protein n=1 Tax=Xylocopa violacea TaxID=135666 RepID=A0ABP1P001_XYLVO